MQTLGRRCAQLAGVQLPALTRAAASTATSGKAVLEKEFLVYRWDPEKDGPPEYKSYKVDLNS